MLRDHEKRAVMSILVRVIEAQNEREYVEKQLSELNARLQEARTLRTNAMSALRVFGFDVAAEGLWDRVKAEIGSKSYSQAFILARPADRDATVDDTETEEQHDEEASGETKDTTSPASTANVARSDVDEGSPSNIRELILQRLGEIGESGSKASDIRDYVQSFGVEMHEKTVGMTLYRLSKEGLAARKGRLWFQAHPEGPHEAAEGVYTEQSSANLHG